MSGSAFEQTIERARSGDAGALSQLLAELTPKLVRMIELRMDARSRRRFEPADVVQDALVEATRRFDEWRAQERYPFQVWLRLLTAQELARAQRRHFVALKRSAVHETELEPGTASSLHVADWIVSTHTSPTQAARRAELRERVVAALGELEALDREILVLRHFEELSNEGAAAELDIEPAAASKRFARATSFELFIDGDRLAIEARRRPASEQVEWARQAFERFDEAVARAPQARALYHHSRVWAASLARDEGATRAACDAMLVLWPDSARALHQAGAAISGFDPRSALPLLERSIRLDPTYAPTFQCLGVAHLKLGDCDEARAALERAIEIDPLDVAAHNGLAATFHAMGCFDEERAALLEALSIDPSFIAAWGNFARLEREPGMIALATELVLDLDPGQMPYRALHGVALEALGDVRGACEQLAIVVAQGSENPLHWAKYTEFLSDLGEPQAALDAAAVVRSLDPSYPGLEQVEEQLRLAVERAAAQ